MTKTTASTIIQLFDKKLFGLLFLVVLLVVFWNISTYSVKAQASTITCALSPQISNNQGVQGGNMDLALNPKSLSGNVGNTLSGNVNANVSNLFLTDNASIYPGTENLQISVSSAPPVFQVNSPTFQDFPNTTFGSFDYSGKVVGTGTATMSVDATYDFIWENANTGGQFSYSASCHGTVDVTGIQSTGTIQVDSKNLVTGQPVPSSWYFPGFPTGADPCQGSVANCSGTSVIYPNQRTGLYTIDAPYPNQPTPPGYAFGGIRLGKTQLVKSPRSVFAVVEWLFGNLAQAVQGLEAQN